MSSEEDEGWADWVVGNAVDAVGFVIDTASGAFESVTDTAADAGVFVAENVADTRDAILETGAEIVDGIGDDAARGAIGVAVVTPASIALGGLLVAVALNPSLLTNATKSVKKLF